MDTQDSLMEADEASVPPTSSTEPLPSTSEVTGPELYELRRAQWLTPQAAGVTADTSRTNAKLEAVLSTPGVEEDEQLWDQYLNAVHEGLVGGKRFKKGVKLNMAVKILKAGWLRDGTWDVAAAASSAGVSTTALSSTTTGPYAARSKPNAAAGRPSPHPQPSRHRVRLRSFITSSLHRGGSGAPSTSPTPSYTVKPPPPPGNSTFSVTGKIVSLARRMSSSYSSSRRHTNSFEEEERGGTSVVPSSTPPTPI